MEIVADLHVHTVASGHAFNTIDELTKEAHNKGLQLIGITDHGPALPGSANDYYFKNLRIVPNVMNEVIVLKGIESNIINKAGSLDLAQEYLDKLDIVLVGFHEGCYLNNNAEENTKTLIKVIQKPNVSIIAHLGNPNFPVDYYEVISEAVKNNVAIEINNASLTIARHGSRGNCLKIAEICADLNAMISIASDAHISYLMGELTEAIKLVNMAGIKEKYILNLSIEKIMKFIGK